MRAAEPLAIPEVKLLRANRFEDARGYFQEVWTRRGLIDAAVDADFVQENQSLSRQVGTVRGLHLQAPPYAQGKLVRVLRGAIFDVAVDLRKSAATFGRWVAATLTAAAGEQLFIPVGFAHGFCTVAPDTEVAYLVTAPYARDSEMSIAWNDPGLAIGWPAVADAATMSAKDRDAPRFADFASPF